MLSRILASDIERLFNPGRYQALYTPELISQFESTVWNLAPVQNVVREYVKRGGSAELLGAILYHLWVPLPKYAKPPRAYHMAVRRLKRDLEALSGFTKTPESERWPKGAQVDVGLLSLFVDEALDVMKGKKSFDPPRVNRASLIPAILSFELRQYFNRPCYEEVLVLAKSATPETFPASTRKEHMRQRILSVPIPRVKHAYRYFYSLVHKTPPPQV